MLIRTLYPYPVQILRTEYRYVPVRYKYGTCTSEYKSMAVQDSTGSIGKSEKARYGVY